MSSDASIAAHARASERALGLLLSIALSSLPTLSLCACDPLLVELVVKGQILLHEALGAVESSRGLE